MSQLMRDTEGPKNQTDCSIRLFEPTRHEPSDTAGPTLGDLFERYYCGQRQLSPGSMLLYRTALNHLRRVCGRDPALDELSARMLLDLASNMGDASPATINKTLRHVLAVWRWAWEEGFCQMAPPPMRKVKRKEPKRIPRAWDTSQLATLLAAAERLRGFVVRTPARLWWRALVLFLYDTGLRIDAAMQLSVSSIEWERQTVFVPAEIQKQAADQLLGLSAETLAALRAIERETPLFVDPDERLFPWPFDRRPGVWRTLTRHFRRLLLAAGLPASRRDLFHKLRRTNASYIHAAGGNPTEQLGHSSAGVTRRYLDPAIARRERQVDLLPRPS